MKIFVAFPLAAAIVAGASQANCSTDTLFLCLAMIVAGWLASND